MASSVRRRLVIGVDFGTTFSAVAWAIGAVDSPETVKVITQWPSNTGRVSSEKVPTKLRLLGNDESEWGFLISTKAPNNEILQWFKLYVVSQHITISDWPFLESYADGSTNAENWMTGLQ